MKKYLFTFLALFVVAIVVTMASRSSGGTGSGIYISGDEGQPLADSVMKIVKVACMDCHADGGNGMASSHVNFSKWSSYKAEKQKSKAKEICKVLTKGVMPPKKYRASNPDIIPTQAQVTTICNWAKSISQ